MNKKTPAGGRADFKRFVLLSFGCSTEALDRPSRQLSPEERQKQREELSKLTRKILLDNLEFSAEMKRQARRDAIFFDIFKWAVIISTFVFCWFCLFVAPAGLQILLGL